MVVPFDTKYLRKAVSFQSQIRYNHDTPTELQRRLKRRMCCSCKFTAFQKLQRNQKMLSHHCHPTQCCAGSVINFYFNWCLGFKFRKLKQSIKALDKCVGCGGHTLSNITSQSIFHPQRLNFNLISRGRALEHFQ